MAVVSNLIIRYTFTRGDETKTELYEFDSFHGSLESDIDNVSDDFLCDFNYELADSDDEWELDGYEVEAWDTDYADPSDFTDFDEYGEYAENVEAFGEAFHLRYEDTANTCRRTFEDEYVGCYDEFQDYAEAYVDDCFDIPDCMANYFDYEKFARDLQMDYSVYDGNEGEHIFRD